jgi:hypothetical protein
MPQYHLSFNRHLPDSLRTPPPFLEYAVSSYPGYMVSSYRRRLPLLPIDQLDRHYNNLLPVEKQNI